MEQARASGFNCALPGSAKARAVGWYAAGKLPIVFAVTICDAPRILIRQQA